MTKKHTLCGITLFHNNITMVRRINAHHLLVKRLTTLRYSNIL